MKQSRQTIEVQGPLGIIIADGARGEVVPRFLAYVWGPAPEPEPAEVANEPKAA